MHLKKLDAREEVIDIIAMRTKHRKAPAAARFQEILLFGIITFTLLFPSGMALKTEERYSEFPN